MGEEGYYVIVHTELAVGHGEPNCRRGEALTEGVHRVDVVRPVRRPPSLSNHPAMTDQHEAVHFMFAMLDRVEESEDARRGHPFRFRCATGKLARPGHRGDCLAPGHKRKETNPSRADANLF